MRVPLRVLIVEDLPEQAEIVAHELTNAGFALAWSIASDLAGCRSVIESGVDVVIADCEEVDLPALMALVREVSDPPPVVGLSTDDDEEVARECLRSGASAFLHKFQLDGIGSLVRDLIEARSRRRTAATNGDRSDARGFAENACDLIVELASDGRVLYANPSVERELGYAVDELAGRRAFELLHPDDLPRAIEFLRDAMETGSARRGVHRVRRRDGSWCRLDSTGSPYRTPDGERRVLAISREATEAPAIEGTLPGGARRPGKDLHGAKPLKAPDPRLVEIADGLLSVFAPIASGSQSVDRELDPSSPLRRDLDRIHALVDRGTAIVRRLRAIAAADEVAAHPPNGAPEAMGREAILLVLGGELLRSVIRETLEEDGYSVVQAASGEEALERAAHHGSICLVLCDAVLPDIDGRELTTRIAASHPGVRAILMSDSAGAGAEPIPEGNHGPRLLRKPFTLAALRATLHQTLVEDPDPRESG